MNRFPFISLFRPTQAKNKPRFTRGLPFFPMAAHLRQRQGFWGLFPFKSHPVILPNNPAYRFFGKT